MSRVSERKFIYSAYGIVFLLILLFAVVKVSAWELKHDYKKPLTKPCAACLADFAGCMDLVDKAFGEDEDADPARYVDYKLSCVKQAANCGEENKCGTRVVLDGK